MLKLRLHWQILIALALGVAFGALCGAKEVSYVSWMGTLFLRALKMVVIPLIISSIISGVTSIGSAGSLGRLGMKTIGYYLLTSILAVLTGLFLVNLIKPGVGTDLGLTETVDTLVLTGESFGETLIKIVPDNIFAALTEFNMLSIIFFSVLFGFFITQSSEKSRNMLTGIFDSVFEVMMKITMFIIRFTPFGVFGIVAHQVFEAGDIVELGKSMGIYMVCVVLGLMIHAGIVLPVLLKLIGRIAPGKHLLAVSTPLLTAFSTASSSATLPLTMDAVENKSGVSRKITSFTLPLGATINMDGTALYECVAAVFIAQAYGIEMSFAQQMIIVVTALLASIGAAGIPMAGLVMITVILTAVGLPLEGVGLILAVDPILDMFRTTVNVWSDTCGAVIIAKSEKETLLV